MTRHFQCNLVIEEIPDSQGTYDRGELFGEDDPIQTEGGAIMTEFFYHGFVKSPRSRACVCKDYKDEVGWEEAKRRCGTVIDDAQSLEAPKGFPQGGPPDGQIASAGGRFEGTLDQQTKDRWEKVPLLVGPQKFTWEYTARHPTEKWEYFITRTDWDPNQRLTRASFDLTPIATIPHDGSLPDPHQEHTVVIPDDHFGYHIILAVWTVADTANAFYNVIDVNLSK